MTAARIFTLSLSLAFGITVGVLIGTFVLFPPSHPTYSGAPVAGFTTGARSCSPICGHRQ